MKLVAVLLCTCVVGAFATFAPVVKSVSGAAANAGIGLGKTGAEQSKAADQVRATSKSGKAAQQWESHDVKKSSVDQDFEKQGNRASHDATAQRQAHGQQSAGWDRNNDAANKAASKAAAASADKTAKDKWANEFNFETQQAWAGNDGFKKNNKKHEGISYSFDKKFRRNDNENGGFNAGHKLADRSLDDVGLSRSSYDRVAGDHGARNSQANRQSADRSSGYGDSAWNNARSADRHGRDRNQAATGHSNDRDWAEKRDDANNLNRYSRYGKARASDVLRNSHELDRNANRDTLGYGAANKGVYGKNYGAAAPVGYGYGLGARKVVGDVGVKGLNAAKGVADRSNVWDSAKINKNQDWASLGAEDSNKQGDVANRQQEDQLQKFNKQQTGWHFDKGFAQDAAARGNGAQAANRNWADADSARAAQQGRHDEDEVKKLRANNQWNRSDRNRKVNEYKKFFSNDKKGGQNWERLKYNKDQTEDAAAADFANKQDAANRWQNAHRSDERNQAAHSADTARAHDASDNEWNQDNGRQANGAQKKAGAAQDGANSRVWAASNKRSKYGVDQALDDARDTASWAQDRAGNREGYDARALKGAKNAYGSAAGPAYGNYGGYGTGYGAGYGNGYGAGYGNGAGYGGNGVYGFGGYNNGYNGYPGNAGYNGYPSKVNNYGGNYGKGFGAFPNYY